jgi:hypothetical protein
VALLAFGCGFYLWSVPMVWALVRLLRAERAAEADARRTPTAVPVKAAAARSGHR